MHKRSLKRIRFRPWSAATPCTAHSVGYQARVLGHECLWSLSEPVRTPVGCLTRRGPSHEGGSHSVIECWALRASGSEPGAISTKSLWFNFGWKLQKCLSRCILWRKSQKLNIAFSHTLNTSEEMSLRCISRLPHLMKGTDPMAEHYSRCAAYYHVIPF